MSDVANETDSSIEPTRAKSAFFHYMTENREKIKQPGMSVSDVAKAAGEAWNTLEDKSKWEQIALEDRQRYEQELADYKDNFVEEKMGMKGTERVMDPNAPRSATSAFFYYMTENREKIKQPGMSVSDVAKAAGEAWNNLKDKSKWEQMALEDRQRYEQELTNYRPNSVVKPLENVRISGEE
ncbi:HMG box [Aphelenchoides besseyi]|nr:HMG box [Aphelenchoides besseyi]KAI6216443.1 HMG box [Aphelenchoides besseyi]